MTQQAGETSSGQVTRLCDFIQERQAEIIQQWEKCVPRLLSGSDGLGSPVLRDYLPHIIEHLAHAVRSVHTGNHKSAWEESSGEDSSGELRDCPMLGCLGDGCTLAMAIGELSLLRQAILELWEVKAAAVVSVKEVRRLDELLDGLLVRTGRLEDFLPRLRSGLLDANSTVDSANTARKQAEERLRRILETVAEGVAVVEPGGRIILANAAAERMLRLSRRDILARTYDAPEWHVVRLDGSPLPTEELPAARVLATGQPVQDFLHRLIFPDGSSRVLSINAAPLRRPSGELEGVVSTFRDATESRRMVEERERLLAQVESQRVLLDAILDQLPVGVAVGEAPGGRLLRTNAACTTIWRRSVRVDSLADYKEFRGFHPDGRPYSPEDWPMTRSILRGETVRDMEIAIERADGTRRVTLQSSTPIQDARGRTVAAVTTVQDITERKRAEQTQALLVEASALLAQSLDVPTTLRSIARLAADHFADYCIVDIIGEDGRLHRVELAAKDSKIQALLLQAPSYPPALGSTSPLVHALETGVPVLLPKVTSATIDEAANSPEHRRVMEELGPKAAIILPLMARGRKLGIISMVWTVEREERFEADVRVAKALTDRAAVAMDNARLFQEAQEAARVREDVVAVVSHDLRNPLNAITLSASMLIRHEGIDARTAKAATRILSAAERANHLIRGLLDFTLARKGGIPVARKPGDLYAIARQVVEEVRAAHPERRIQLHTAGDTRAELDADRMGQVVANLVGNAVQHSPEGSPVSVRTRAEGRELILSVHNDGSPIPPEAFSSLYEPFRRGREVGPGASGSLGLGLFISHRIVKAHGGTIEVQSSAEQGTTFVVRLPR